MHDSKEKATHRLPMPLPKSKEGVPDDMDEDEEKAITTAIGDSTKDDDDNDANKDTGDLPVAMQREFLDS